MINLRSFGCGELASAPPRLLLVEPFASDLGRGRARAAQLATIEPQKGAH
jgi:hypothetical protein